MSFLFWILLQALILMTMPLAQAAALVIPSEEQSYEDYQTVVQKKI